MNIITRTPDLGMSVGVRVFSGDNVLSKEKRPERLR